MRETAELARRYRSPFHLARSFRRQTGYTLHEYRTHLRLRAALERLAAGDEEPAVIAHAQADGAARRRVVIFAADGETPVRGGRGHRHRLHR